MNPLPQYIYNHPDGLLVRLRRHGVLYQVFIGIPGGGTRAASAGSSQRNEPYLKRAIALRDRFLKLAGEVRVLSNTGIRGISETVRWYHSKDYPAFAVRWPGTPRQSAVFTYRACGGRAGALRAAVALRARMTGETIPEAQIERALNV